MRIKEPWDRYLMMTGLSVLLALVNIYGPFWQVLIISWVFTFAYWEGNYQIVSFIREKYPKIEQTRTRILTQVDFSLLYSIGVNGLIVWLMDLTSIMPITPGFILSRSLAVWSLP